MLKRTITSAVLIALFIPVLIYSDTYALPLLFSLVGTVILFEVFRCTGDIKYNFALIPVYITALILPPAIRYMIINYTVEKCVVLCFFIALLLCLYLFALTLFKIKNFTYENAARIFLFTFYIVNGLGAIVIARMLPPYGAFDYLLIFFGAWITDTFCYFGGFCFGKHKLAPVISPKKTVEGAVSGVIFCTLFFIFYGVVIQSASPVRSNLVLLSVCGFICGIFAQVGDLIFSAVKRRYATKDFGNILPGHGGMADRFDSVLGIAPILLIISYFLDFFISV